MWHNFGNIARCDTMQGTCLAAFNNGVTHFNLANNYGPEPSSTESNLGRVLKKELASYRDELIISTKAGYGLWLGFCGDGGSRTYLLASLDQSLWRLGLDYVDIFYHRMKQGSIFRLGKCSPVSILQLFS